MKCNNPSSLPCTWDPARCVTHARRRDHRSDMLDTPIPTYALRDADEVVGRITRKGTWDRRYKVVRPEPEPVHVEWHDVIEALAGFVVLTLLFAAVYIWMLIGAAAQ